MNSPRLFIEIILLLPVVALLLYNQISRARERRIERRLRRLHIMMNRLIDLSGGPGGGENAEAAEAKEDTRKEEGHQKGTQKTEGSPKEDNLGPERGQGERKDTEANAVPKKKVHKEKSPVARPQREKRQKGGKRNSGQERAMSSEDREFLKQLSGEIRKELKAGRDANVRAVASAMCLSERQLHRRVSALTGESTIGYVLREKAATARRMIEGNPQQNLGEVAERCGFNDYSTFLRAFRSFHDMSPKQFADQLRV